MRKNGPKRTPAVRRAFALVLALVQDFFKGAVLFSQFFRASGYLAQGHVEFFRYFPLGSALVKLFHAKPSF